MATKKKTRKKSTKSKKTASRKVTPAKKRAPARKPPTKSAKKAAAPKKPLAKKKSMKKAARGKAAVASQGASNKEIRKKSPGRRQPSFSLEIPGSRSGGQSGDEQGLSQVESADSESVDELMEEGNAFEAGVVTGVEDAGDHDEEEVHTHEVPEMTSPGNTWTKSKK